MDGSASVVRSRFLARVAVGAALTSFACDTRSARPDEGGDASGSAECIDGETICADGETQVCQGGRWAHGQVCGATGCGADGQCAPYTVVVSPAELPTAFRNPDKGWLAYDFTPMTAPGSAAMSPLTSTVYTNFISWGDLEPFEGQYRWDLIDRLVNAYPAQKIKFAVVLVDPTSRPWCGALGYGQTPAWLSNQLYPGAGRWVTQMEGLTVPYTSQCGGGSPAMVFEPYYWDSRFLTAHGNFVYALARRYFFNDEATAGYAGAPDWAQRVSGIEIASYGAWGEWHSDITWPSDEVKRSALRTLILHFHQAFSTYAAATGKDPPELEQSTVGSTIGPANDIYGSADPSQVYFSVHEAPMASGVRSAMVRKFIGADPSRFFHADEQTIVSTHIATAPFRLEWGSCSGAITQAAFACLGGTPDTVETAVERALSFHASSIGWYANTAADGFPLSAIKAGGTVSIEDDFQIRSGYRFFVSEFRFPNEIERAGSLTIESRWHQRATSKLYRKHYLAAFLDDGPTSIPLGISDSLTAHEWPVGPVADQVVTSIFDLPDGVPPGAYTLKFAVVDRFGSPAMNLAIEGKEGSDPNAYGAYVLGRILVRPAGVACGDLVCDLGESAFECPMDCA